MTNTYLLEIIRVLDAETRLEIGLFLDSSLFNGGSNAVELRKLYQVVLQAAPDFKEELLQKESVYPKVFTDKSVVTGKLEKLMMELNKLLRQYLLIKRYGAEKNEPQTQLDWVAWLREQGLNNRSEVVFAKMKKLKRSEKSESLEQYWMELKLLEEEHEQQSIPNQENRDRALPQLIESLDLYYQNYKIELLNRYLLQQKWIPLPDLDTQPKGVAYYKEASLLYDIKDQIGALLQNELPDTAAFQHLLQLLKEQEAHIPFSTQAHLYTYLRNFCTLLINAGHITYVNLLHQINQDNLAQGLFFINKELDANSYINIVQIAIRAKDIHWAKSFTETYKNRIIGGDKDRFFYKSNLAHCLFAEGEWEDALAQMPEPTSHSNYHGMIRLLELKAYYELRSDLLSYKLYAFRKYFERTAVKSVPANARSMYIEFFNILLQISQSPLKDKARAQRLIERIQKKKLLADRAWLLEKAMELA